MSLSAGLCPNEVRRGERTGEEWDGERFLAGEITPVFFGSALTNYGVLPFLDYFLKEAPAPTPRTSVPGLGRVVLTCCESPNPNDPGTGGYGFRIDGGTRVDFGTSVIAFFEMPSATGPFYDDPLGLTFGPQPWSPTGGGLELGR